MRPHHLMFAVILCWALPVTKARAQPLRKPPVDAAARRRAPLATPPRATQARPVPRAASRRARPRPSKTRYTLAKLIGLVKRKGPAVKLARARVKMAEAALLKAKLLWVPSVKLSMAFAPSPKVKCVVPEAFRQVQMSGSTNLYDWMHTNREKYCLGTDATDDVADFFKRYDPTSYWFRLDLSLGQPLYTFGKIRYAKKLARAGVEASRHRVRQSSQQAVQDVRRAYFGLKLARELLFEIDDNWHYLEKAKKRLDKQLAADTGNVDLVEKYQLQILMAGIRDRVLQLKRAERLALAALRALLGRKTPRNFDVDKAPLEQVTAKVKPLKHYLALAKRKRPELQLLQVAVKASKAAVSLSKARFLPDLLFVMKFSSKTSSSVDDPKSAYLRDSLHGTGIFMGLMLKWDLDFHFKYADLSKARARLLAARHLREQASLGIELQIEKAHDGLETAQKRLVLLKKARKAAKSWLITMSQRHDIGTASTKKLTDSLKAFFQTQLKVHQAVYEFNLAAAELSRVVGVDVTERWTKKGAGK